MGKTRQPAVTGTNDNHGDDDPPIQIADRGNREVPVATELGNSLSLVCGGALRLSIIHSVNKQAGVYQFA
jgi:hypothetical protein